MTPETPSHSPEWGNTTKLVVALTFVAVAIGLLIQFHSLIGPLLLAFILAFLIQPLAMALHKRLHLPWGLAVILIYFLVILSLLGLLTWGGISLVEQFQSLIRFLDRQFANLPDYLSQLENQVFRIGPFEYNLRNLELNSLANQLLGSIQAIFAQAGTLLGTFASSAASTIGWFLFILLISYFILAESGGLSKSFLEIEVPGHQEDINRLRFELARIWNAFLRGQFIIIAMTLVIYTMLLGILGVRFFLGLALMAALARFVPYVGPAIAWTTYGLVSYFQGSTIFGLSPLVYAIVVIALALITDSIIDNFVTPRLLANALQVHPAAVLVAALVGASFIGVVGIVLAAPVMATAKLFTEYSLRKLLDLDPWKGLDNQPPVHRETPPEQFVNRWKKFKKWVKEKQAPREET
ncbi:MAG: AI-2E family transporter [Chloroflexi bacterium]|jgi:predicted PurR-regulated permease PerM|nr:AI-2E family transporter [Anaerolineaceae bacterium]NMB91145.1 AI-2E family transporter [Chloroflexota bacterium]